VAVVRFNPTAEVLQWTGENLQEFYNWLAPKGGSAQIDDGVLVITLGTSNTRVRKGQHYCLFMGNIFVFEEFELHRAMGM
jgi:hypothetical protein